MRNIVFAAAAMLTLGAAPGPAQAQPGGCLKYGLGGAVAGHFAGGHRLKGALAGCALGVYERRRYEARLREERARQERRRSEERDRVSRRDRIEEPRSAGRERAREPDADETGSTGGFSRGGYFSRGGT